MLSNTCSEQCHTQYGVCCCKEDLHLSINACTPLLVFRTQAQEGLLHAVWGVLAESVAAANSTESGQQQQPRRQVCFFPNLCSGHALQGLHRLSWNCELLLAETPWVVKVNMFLGSNPAASLYSLLPTLPAFHTSLEHEWNCKWIYV